MTHNGDYSVGIRAVGTHVPRRTVTNAELERSLPTTDEWIRAHIGVETRHIAAEDEGSSDLGVAALLDACKRAGLPPESIDLVICGTYTPDNMIPATASAIMRKAQLTDATGFDVNSGGCAGGVFALDVGAKYIASGEYSRVAVVLTDVTSKVLDRTDRTTAVIFGDAAACYLLEACAPGRGIQHTSLKSAPDAYFTAHVAREQRQDHDGTPIRSGYGDNFLVMAGRQVRDFALTRIPKFIHELVRDAGTDVAEVDLLLLHQANLHIINEVVSAVGLPPERTLTNVERFGNTSGAGMPMALCEAAESGRLAPGDLIVLTAFGAGMNYAGSVLRWCGSSDFTPPIGSAPDR
ncbi:ketoacyl-ACP synthase III [Nocardiopsis rhodophaea]|uniref:3-oxoacyl-ACP synthase III family protein n=1 Tax=Nocardiopsis rhodophaea TaxID=280238 RepID=UPI0031D039C7